MVEAIRHESEEKRREALDFLAQNYWKPVYYYLLRAGRTPHDAEDLTQGFFEFAIQRNTFAKAERERGHFRTFLLRALQNFQISEFRKQQAAMRRPDGGFVSIHELVKTDAYPIELKHNETPEAVFTRAWFQGLLLRVLKILRANLRESGMAAHYEILNQFDIQPWLDGVERPAQAELAIRMGLTAKEVSRRLGVARQALEQLLRKEIECYASSPSEIASEWNDFRRSLGANT